MGRVYQAKDPDSGRDVAVKTILDSRLSSASALPRFLREIQILSSLDHPGVVRILDRGKTDSGHFLVMELVQGEALDRVLKRKSLPSHDEALRIGEDVASALDYLHQHGIIHRDLKPGNLIRTPEGRVVLIDFGLSRFLDEGATVTGTGRIIGSPHYLPPEQWRGKKPDERADVYQFGILMLELMTGKVPFSGSDLRAIMESCLTYGITRQLLAELGIGGGLQTFLRRCTYRNRDKRYPSMGVLLRELRSLRAGKDLMAKGAWIPAADPMEVSQSGQPAKAVRAFSSGKEVDVDLDAPTREDLPAPPSPPKLEDSEPGLVMNSGIPGKESVSVDGYPKAPSPPPPLTGTNLTATSLSASSYEPAQKVFQRRMWLSVGVSCGLFLSLLAYLNRTPPPPPEPKLVGEVELSEGVAAVRVRWRTDRPSPGIVRVRGPGGERQIRDPEGILSDHEVTVRDLEEGQKYHFTVMGKHGPLAAGTEVRTRGVSIAFEPHFTGRGLELHWKSEDPLVLKPEAVGKRSRPRAVPDHQGTLLLPGVRPGSGRITVLAFAPLGSVLSVPYTVPDLAEIESETLQYFEALARRDSLHALWAQAARGDREGALAGLRARAQELSHPKSPLEISTQAGVLLEHGNLRPRQRDSLLSSWMQLLSLTGLELDNDLRGALGLRRVSGDLYGTESYAEQALGGRDPLFSYLAPPFPLLARTPRKPQPIPPPPLSFRPALELDPRQRVVTFALRALGLGEGRILRLKLASGRSLLFFNSLERARKEALGGYTEGSLILWTVPSAWAAEALAGVELELLDYMPELATSEVRVQSLECFDGRMDPEDLE